MNEKLETVVLNFLESYSGPFDITDIVDYAEHAGMKLGKTDVFELLTTRHLAFYDPVSNKFMSRAGLFSGRSFSIAPTRKELMTGILFVGHRCVPFVNPELFPHQIIFLYRDDVIPRKQITVPTEEIYSYYYLFGDEYVPQFLTFDNEDNNEAFRASDFEEPEVLDVTVLDMSAIYWDLHMEPGDRFSVEVVDWLHGIVELSHVPARTVSKHRCNEWKRSMEQAFLKSFETVGPSASMEEQILCAFLVRFDALIDNKDCSLEEFMSDTKTIDIVPYGVESRFWKINESIPVSGNWTNSDPNHIKTDIEELFWQLGFSMPEYIIAAYIRDDLFQRFEEPDAILSRLIPAASISDNVRKRITSYLVAARLTVEHNYNWFRDQKIGPMRARLVALHAGISVFIHRLDSEGICVDDLPETPFIILSQLLKHVCSTIENLTAIVELDTFDYDSLAASLDGMEESFFDVKTQILDSFDTISKKRFEIVDGGEAMRRGVYVSILFDVSGKQKQSVREIVVPAAWTFESVFYAVAASCGITAAVAASFMLPAGTIVPQETPLELIMHNRADNISLTIKEPVLPGITSILLKGIYTGNQIMPFCEYAAGPNVVAEKERNILLFPGMGTVSAAENNGNDDVIPTAADITALLQTLVRSGG